MYYIFYLVILIATIMPKINFYNLFIMSRIDLKAGEVLKEKSKYLDFNPEY
jgi:hypothetical protein